MRLPFSIDFVCESDLWAEDGTTLIVSLDEWNEVLFFFFLGEMRRATFSANMDIVLNRLRFKDGKEEGREKCEGEKCGVKELQQASPFPAHSLVYPQLHQFCKILCTFHFHFRS